MRSALLEWCNNVLQPQGITVRNFTENWKDGRAFCGLVNALQPNSINLAECTPDKAEQNLNKAFDLASSQFQFPKILEASDVIQYQDELSIITYVSYYRQYLSKNAAFAAKTYAEGPGLHEALNSKPAHFTIFACDQDGNRVNRGGAFIRLNLKEKKTGKECGQFTIKDNLDGTYNCSYETEKYGTKGNFELHIKVGSTPILGSYFTPQIIPWEADPSKCVASGPGISHARAGVQTSFTVQTRDLKGDPITRGNANIFAHIKDGPNEIPVSIVDNGDGTYTGTYATQTASNVTLHVFAKTEAFGTGPISGGPFKVTVGPGEASAAFTVATGPGTSTTTSGLPTQVLVQTFDKFGNKVKDGGAPINGEVITNGVSTPVKVVDNGDGTYTVDYKINKIGNHTLNIKVGDQLIKGAPFNVRVDPGAVSIENTEVHFLDHARAGLSVGTVHLLDEHRNTRLTGGDQVVAVCKPISGFAVTAHDNGDGSYAVIYPPNARGKYKVNVSVNGNPAPKGPWEVEVKSNEVKPEVKQQISKILPKSAATLSRLFNHTTDEERSILLAELAALKK